MEQYPVRKIEKPIDWCVTVPGSKSMTNRALLMAALSDGTTVLSDDGISVQQIQQMQPVNYHFASLTRRAVLTAHIERTVQNAQTV